MSDFNCFVDGCKRKWRYRSRGQRIACCEKHTDKFLMEVLKRISAWDFETNWSKKEWVELDKELACKLAVKSVQLKGQLEIVNRQLDEIKKKKLKRRQGNE